MRRYLIILAYVALFFMLLPDLSDGQFGAVRTGRTTDGFNYRDRRRSMDIMDQGRDIYESARSAEELEEAAKKYQEAAHMAEMMNDVRVQGRAANRLGTIKLMTGRYQEALELFQKSLEYARQAKDVEQESRAHANIGRVYERLRRTGDAEQSFSEAMEIAEKTDDKIRKARALKGMADLDSQRGNKLKALEKYEQAAKLARDASERDDISALGVMLTAAGRMNAALGNHERATELLKEAVEASKAAGVPRTEADAYRALGQAYQATGNNSQAIKHLEHAKAMNVQLGNLNTAVENSRDVGFIYLDRGQYQNSVQAFTESLEIARQMKDAKVEAISLGNLGRAYMILGNYPSALDHLQQAIEIAEKEGLKNQAAEWLISLGRLFFRWGKQDKANEFVEKGLKIAERNRDKKTQAEALTQSALAHYTNGQYKESLEMVGRVKKLGPRSAVAGGSIDDLEANVYLDMGELQTAEKIIAKSGSPAARGRLHLVKNNHKESIRQYEKLRQLAEKTGNVDNRFTAFTGIGLSLEAAGDYGAAADSFQKAIDIVEELRAKLSVHDRGEFYSVRINGFLRTTPYDGLARVLMKMNKPADALKTSEFTKARLFAEAISRRVEGQFQDIPQEIMDKDLEANERLTALLKSRQSAYEKAQSDVVSSLELDIKKTRDELDSHIERLRSDYPLFAATKYPSPMDLTTTAINPNEYVLAYKVTDDGLLIFLTQGKELIKTVIKPVSRKAIQQTLREFLRPLDVSSDQQNILEKLKNFDFRAGLKLREILLEDVLGLVPEGRTLIVSPDDCLGILPFEMLILEYSSQPAETEGLPQTSGARFLEERNSVLYCQSITSLSIARTVQERKGNGERILVIADPVFSTEDPRCTDAPLLKKDTVASGTSRTVTLMQAQGLKDLEVKRLPLTGNLAKSLAELYRGKSDMYVGLDAAKDLFFARVVPSLPSYGFVVFATHGLLDSSTRGMLEPALLLSLVPVGTDGLLRSSEVMGLRLQASVVVLAACQSGLGRHVSGEGTMGMGRAFQYAGAQSVLMSMWSVAEAPTMQLFQSFFKYLSKGHRKLEALRLARSDLRTSGYNHPFFWAPFILVGEAR